MPQSPPAQPSTTQSQLFEHVMSPQAVVPLQPTRQRPIFVPPCCTPQVTSLHAFVPSQVMMQSPAPHVMLWQALSPMHMIVHFSAFVHVIEPHASPLHEMLHVLPCGHVMLSPPLPVTLHVPSLPQPPLHTAGHALSSITQ